MQTQRRKIAGFYLTEHLGSGGMSDVYLGCRPRTGEQRAVKILQKKAGSSPKAYARFLREVEIMQKLDHPNIVRVIEAGALDDCYFYMMEYLSHGSLAQKQGRASIASHGVYPIFEKICRAMAYAHRKGIIHRDLKPANILLKSPAEPAISDFGIAKIIDADVSLTRSTEVMGTIAYLAPEQRLSSKKVDPRADVFALGTVLYEMFMGFPPLGNFPWPSESDKNCPAPLQALLQRCLALDPADRYENAGDLLAALREIAEAVESLLVPKQNEESPETPKTINLENRRSDRFDDWLQRLRNGSTSRRLETVREMTGNLNGEEVEHLLQIYSFEEDRVRWALIRIFGEMRVTAALPLMISEMEQQSQRESAIETLGKIGSPRGFDPILEHMQENPHAAMMCLLPLARTGRTRAIPHLMPYLSHEMTIIRRTAARALAEIGETECARILKSQLAVERDENVRATLLASIRDMARGSPEECLDRALGH